MWPRPLLGHEHAVELQPGLAEALAGGDAWLQVLVDGELLAPLQLIGTVPYARSLRPGRKILRSLTMAVGMPESKLTQLPPP